MSSNLIYSPSAARVLNSIPSNEHTAGDRTPYCYLIGWTKHNMWYYGRRTAKRCHPSEFWKKYKTSSKYVNEFVDSYGEPDIKIIRKIFNSTQQCSIWENKVLERLDACHRSDFLNKRNGDSLYDTTKRISVFDIQTNKRVYIPCDLYHANKSQYEFHTSKMTTVIGVDGECKSIPVLEYRENKQMYQALNTNVSIVKDFENNQYNVDTTHPMLKTGELIGVNSVESWYFDVVTELPVKTLKNNPLVLSGSFVKIPKKKYVYTDGNGNFFYKSANDDFIANGILTKTLFPVIDDVVTVYDENNNIVKTKSTDERISSGLFTIKHRATQKNRPKGLIPVKDICGNNLYVSVNDERLKTGEIKRTLADYVSVKDLHGNRFSVKVSDPRFKTGEIVGANKNTSPYKNLKTGKRVMLEKDDPRTLDSDNFIKFDCVADRAKMIARPEVQELLEIAKSKNLKMFTGWTYAKDISKARDYILNSPPNSSQYTRSSKD